MINRNVRHTPPANAHIVKPAPITNQHPAVIAGRKVAAKAIGHVVSRYKIVDPTHTPDLRGELAGSRVIKIGADSFVNLTETQAKFYLDSGSIVLAPGA